MYTPVSSLEAFAIVKFTVTIVTFPLFVRVLKLSLTKIRSLKIPFVIFHKVVGGGKPAAWHVTVVVFPSLVTELDIGLTTAISAKCIYIKHETDIDASVWTIG